MKLDRICRINVFGVVEHRMEMYRHQRRPFFCYEKHIPVQLLILSSRVTSLLMSWVKQDVDFIAPAQSTSVLFDIMRNTPPRSMNLYVMM
jgi:hypothetical protein